MAQDCSRGIKNSSGVSCHLSSALQIIYHAIPQYCRKDVILLSKKLPKVVEPPVNLVSIIIELGNVIEKMGMPLMDENSYEKDNSLIFNYNRDDGVDASVLYKLLANAKKADYLKIGDAGASLRAMLGLLAQALEECMAKTRKGDGYDDEIISLAQKIHKCLTSLFWMGSLCHQIVGTKKFKECGEGCISKYKKVRSKAPKVRPLPCPLTIPVRGKRSIHASVSSLIASEHPIIGYDWDKLDHNEYNEDKHTIDEANSISCSMKNVNITNNHINEDSPSTCSDHSSDSFDSNSDSSQSSSSSSCSSSSSSSSSMSSDNRFDMYEHWRTNKVIRCKTFPQVLILQLNRSEYKGGKVQFIKDGIKVPFELSFDKDIELEGTTGSTYEYLLIGAVVHKDGKRTISPDEHGHYLSYMKGEHFKPDNDEDQLWMKIDDENVTAFVVGNANSKPATGLKVIPRRSLCAMFGGNTKKKDNCATLLIYKLNGI